MSSPDNATDRPFLYHLDRSHPPGLFASRVAKEGEGGDHPETAIIVLEETFFVFVTSTEKCPSALEMVPQLIAALTFQHARWPVQQLTDHHPALQYDMRNSKSEMPFATIIFFFEP